MKLHSDHAKNSLEPLVVTRVVQCGQSRFVSKNKGIDDLTRVYRIEPVVSGTVRVTYHSGSQTWSVTEDLGNDIGGWPLVSLTDLKEIVTASLGWHQMESYIATYFQSPVCEFHADSTASYRVKVAPRVGNGAGQ